jgi:signal transduction histidine kinase
MTRRGGQNSAMTSAAARNHRLPARHDPVQIVLPAAPVSCRLGREFVLSVIGGAEDARVALVVTELVANAVVHGHSQPRLRVGWDGHMVRLEVEDDGPGRPTVQDLDPTTTSGRGLALVDRIADRWGVTESGSDPSDPAAHAKVVWAHIDLGR